MTTQTGQVFPSVIEQPGSGVGGLSPGLYTALTEWINSGDFAAAMAQLFGVTPPQWVPPGMRLPVSGPDGSVVAATVDQTNGVTWTFRYNQKAALPYAWEFVGGPPLVAMIATDEALAATYSSYQDLATPGPAIAAPFSGQYLVQVGATIYNQSGALSDGDMSYAFASTSASDTWAAENVTTTVLDRSSVASSPQNQTIAAGLAFVAKYRSATNNAMNFNKRWMTLTPVRCAGG